MAQTDGPVTVPSREWLERTLWLCLESWRKGVGLGDVDDPMMAAMARDAAYRIWAEARARDA